MNGIDSLTSRMGQYIDHYLQPAYLRDTKQMLQMIEDIPREEGPWILATADVSSLYTIIFHPQACKAAKWGLRTHHVTLCTKEIPNNMFGFLFEEQLFLVQ